jgi:hypothetical protein
MRLIRSLFCEDGDCDKLCVRRVLGVAGFVSCIYAMFHPGIDSQQFSSLLYVSAALLGMTTFDKFVKKG